MRLLAHFRNLLYIFIRMLNDQGPFELLLALTSPYAMEKVVRKKDFFVTINKKTYHWWNLLTSEMQQIVNQIYRLQQIIGHGLSVSIAHQVARSLKATIHQWKKNCYCELPKPRKLDRIHRFTIEIGKDNLKFDPKTNSITIWLGRKREIGIKKFPCIFKLKIPFQYRNRFFEIKRFMSTIYLTWVRDAYIEVRLVAEIQPTFKIDDSFQYAMGIDLGFRNLVAIVTNNPKMKSLVVNGLNLIKFLRDSLNWLKDLQKQENWTGFRLTHKYIKSVVHQFINYIANLVIEYAIQAKCKTIAIGNLFETWYQQCKKHLPSDIAFYVSRVPLGYLVKRIQEKAKLIGIDVKIVDESFTSKFLYTSCVLDDCPRMGKPCANNSKNIEDKVTKTQFHSDCNGAANILLKAGYKIYEFIKAKLCNPIKITIDLFKTHPAGSVVAQLRIIG